jgi:hypothetical protein
MTTINQLSGISRITSGDQIPIYAQNQGDARRMSVGQLLEYFQSTFAAPGLSVIQLTPGTGFNYAIQDPQSSQWVIIQPAGTLASGTVTLPLSTGTPDGTEILVTSTQDITAFTLGLNGASFAYGAPTALAANAFFRMRFYGAANSWYRIG